MIWLNLIPRWALLAALVALSATCAALKFSNVKQSIEIERGKTYVAKIEAAVAQSNADAATQAANFERQAKDAQVAAANRERALRADAGMALDELERLSHATSDYALRAKASAIGTGLDVADVFPELFLNCSRRYVEVAGEADQWRSDAIKLFEAWPK